MISTHWLELPLSRTYFHGPKGVRAIEVRLYVANLWWSIRAPPISREKLHAVYIMPLSNIREVLPEIHTTEKRDFVKTMILIDII